MGTDNPFIQNPGLQALGMLNQNMGAIKNKMNPQQQQQGQAPQCPTCGQHPQAQAILGNLLQMFTGQHQLQKGAPAGQAFQVPGMIPPAAPPTDVVGGNG